jgi:hypothetical protein
MKNRTFTTGANRNSNEGKHDIEGFNNPLVDQSFNEYMHKHRKLEDGSLRDGDNWQKGIPSIELLRSLLRHVHDVRLQMRGHKTGEDILDSLNAVKFNVNGLILHHLEGYKNDVV